MKFNVKYLENTSKVWHLHNIILHSNTAVQPGEQHYSFTQYAAAGLFRYVKNGLHTDKAFMENATKEQLRQRELDHEQQSSNGLELFSTMSEFEAEVPAEGDTASAL